jgi:hypothetical protein
VFVSFCILFALQIIGGVVGFGFAFGLPGVIFGGMAAVFAGVIGLLSGLLGLAAGLIGVMVGLFGVIAFVIIPVLLIVGAIAMARACF